MCFIVETVNFKTLVSITPTFATSINHRIRIQDMIAANFLKCETK